MKHIILRSFAYYLFWTFFFVICRFFFLGYHYDKADELTSMEIFQVIWHGLRMDLSFAGYLSVIPFLLFLNETAFRKPVFIKILSVYTWVLLGLIALLVTADLELYSAWGYRLDATPLQYLNTPAEMIASTSSAPLWLLLLIYIALVGIGYLLYKAVRPLWNISLLNRGKHLAVDLLLSLFLVALLILPIRGGWQQIPLNQSDVYFSQKLFANHSGVNVPWNLMHSLIKKNHQTKNPYDYFEEEKARQLVEELYQSKSDSVPILIKGKKPNILYIILESYTAKFIGPLGGPTDVTPNLNALAKEGIFFTNIYASGDRSEKGMVALLSGYPVQTTTSIIKTPKKTERLPHFAKDLRDNGYATSFYYGGELAFANIKSYLLNGKYGRLIEKTDFSSEHYNSKWGVHDHILFEKVLQEHKIPRRPFFTTVYTLSSHEPFETPIPTKFPGSDDQSKFKNSVYYTDWALGKFIDQAKKQLWWENTLVVIVADHGHPYPGNDPVDAPSKFRIPLLLTGGAVAVKDTIIQNIGSQTDIAPTLLQQLGFPAMAYSWGKNLLDPNAKQFAFYVFNDGFGMVTPDGVVTVDNVSKRPNLQDSTVTEKQIDQGKAYMQTSFADFLKK
ncbi:LTA synthase family protein [Rufibacter roseus]|uniref:LTA synthase family protein n=1 Tax=Rufibacter roseus TaxID=1567108 RepID=A0ABW2DP75_9BACT|nr:LTA synthase family protein [Rufibacter roseus]